MLKKLSLTKDKIIILLVFFVIALGKCFSTTLRMGLGDFMPVLLSIGMCLLFTVIFVLDLPSKFSEMFSGKNLIRVIAIVYFIFVMLALTSITYEHIITTFITFAMLLCVVDIKLYPINVVLSVLSVFWFQNGSIAALPCVLAISAVIFVPKLKKAQTWEKLVFATSVICETAVLCYLIYTRRFNISLQPIISHPLYSAVIILISVMFVIFFFSSFGGKTKTSFMQNIGYLIPVIGSVIWIMMDRYYCISGIMSLLTTWMLLCRDNTVAQRLTDKVANGIGGFVAKLTPKKSEKQ